MTEIKPVKIGDAVTINNGGLEFIVVSIELQNNELMACGEYGCFNITLLDQYQAAKNDMLKQVIVKGEAVLASKMKNLCAKTRPTDNPYEIWRSEGPITGKGGVEMFSKCLVEEASAFTTKDPDKTEEE